MQHVMTQLFGGSGFVPHGVCYAWNQTLVLVQWLSNTVIGLSFVAIALTLGYLVHVGKSVPFKWMALAFGTFLVSCGLSHFLAAVVIWQPWYWLDAGLRVLTALASLGIAVLLPPLVPRALALLRGAVAARERGIELEAAVNSLEGMYETTRELERLKTQFFANISHELRTPLTLVLGPTERLLRAQNLSAEQRRDAELVLRNARTLLRHVNDLMDLSRLEAGKLEARYARSDLARLVRTVASHFDGLASERGMRYVVEAPESLLTELDAELMQRVVLNLIANAFKFTPVAGQIRVTLKDQGNGQALIEVADSGSGVRPEHRRLIFERYQQADASSTRRFGGAGLGLAIAKDFVELHGGQVTVADAPEGGAVFCVELPIRAPEAAHVRESMSERPPSLMPEPNRLVLDELWTRQHASDSLVPVPTHDKPLVLVVEDNADMNRFVCQTLSGEYRTASALDGRTGLEKALRMVPDLVLTDLMMPGMGGEQLVQSIRNSPELDDVPVVLLTGRTEEALRVRLLREGAQDYLIKPFAADELRARVANLIAMKRTRQVLQREHSGQMHDLELLAREVAHQKHELQAALDAMRSAREQAEQASRFKSGFLAMVSHELRTPLAALQLQLERLQRSSVRELPHDKHVLVHRMGSSVGRLYGLIEGLLQYARIESGRFSVRTEPLDIGKMASEVLDELRGVAEEKGLSLRLELDDGDAPEFEGDRELVRLILTHLVENGLKFTEHGQIRVRIGFDDRSCRVTVADSGPGIPRDQQARIFQPLAPGEPAGRKDLPGVGLGLSLVREMVNALGGSITLTSRVGHGTKFSVRLPHRTASGLESPLHASA